jgi:hypothetical protein
MSMPWCLWRFLMKAFSRNKKKLNPGAQHARDHRFIDKVKRGEISAFVPPLLDQDAKRPTVPFDWNDIKISNFPLSFVVNHQHRFLKLDIVRETNGLYYYPNSRR